MRTYIEHDFLIDCILELGWMVKGRWTDCPQSTYERILANADGRVEG